MTYRVEYGGGDIEIPTLNEAIEGAKQAIAADVGPVGEWSVEHDEAINDWFVQGYVNGRPVGPTAVVSGPEPTTAVDPPPARPGAGDLDGWLRSITFDGVTPAEVFGKATAWRLGLGRKARTIATSRRALGGNGSTPTVRLKPRSAIMRKVRRGAPVVAFARITVSADGYAPKVFTRRVTIVR